MLEIGVDSPCVSALPCIALVLSGVQARHEPHTTDCHVPVAMIYLGRRAQKPSGSSGKERGEVENKEKPAKVYLVT